MKIHYISNHSVLEYDEILLFTEMGHDVFSNGAYLNPNGHIGLHRPGVPGMTPYPDLQALASNSPKTNLPTELITPFDVIIVMGGAGDVEILTENWPRIKHKNVIWRTIGQSSPEQERQLRHLYEDGLKIVRYSPKEAMMPDFIGANAMIRFYKDPAEYQGWTGNEKRVINFTQSLKARGSSCYYKQIMETLSGFDAKIYGNGNDNLGNINGGQVSYDIQKGHLRDNRVYLYAGTWPASYSLSFMEAYMTGIPMVAFGKEIFMAGFPSYDIHEIPDLIDHEETGFIAKDIGEARAYLTHLLNDDKLAERISLKARDKAIEVFGKNKIMGEWKQFLNKL